MNIDEIIKNWAQIEIDNCRKQGLKEKEIRQAIKTGLKQFEKIALDEMVIKNE